MGQKYPGTQDTLFGKKERCYPTPTGPRWGFWPKATWYIHVNNLLWWGLITECCKCRKGSERRPRRKRSERRKREVRGINRGQWEENRFCQEYTYSSTSQRGVHASLNLLKGLQKAPSKRHPSGGTGRRSYGSALKTKWCIVFLYNKYINMFVRLALLPVE